MKNQEIKRGLAHFEGLKTAINNRLHEGYTRSKNFQAFLDGWAQVQAHVENFLRSGKEDKI